MPLTPTASPVRINRVKDFVERVAWTAVQAAAATALVVGFDDWRTTAKVAGVAALVAACKVITAQNAGRHGDGSAIPGGVIEGGVSVQ